MRIVNWSARQKAKVDSIISLYVHGRVNSLLFGIARSSGIFILDCSIFAAYMSSTSSRNVIISPPKWDAGFEVERVHVNSPRGGVLGSGEICSRLTVPNHIGRLKKKFNYKFDSPTVTANCTWRRSGDLKRSIIAPRVDCNSDDRSFIVSQPSWRTKDLEFECESAALKKMNPFAVTFAL